MSDLISRAEAIDIIMSLIEEPEDDFNEGVRCSAKMVMSLSSAQLELHWIPVTESVPKDRKIYLVTLDNNTTDFCMWNGSCWGFYGNHGWSECDEVIAWMSLPEPYKEGEQND